MNTTHHITRVTIIQDGRQVYTTPVDIDTDDTDTLRKEAITAYLNEVSKTLTVDLTYHETNH